MHLWGIRFKALSLLLCSPADSLQGVFIRLAGGAALDGLVQDCSLVNIAADQLLVDIVEAQTIHGIGKTLAGDALVTEQQNAFSTTSMTASSEVKILVRG